jgi:hypothetical protein
MIKGLLLILAQTIPDFVTVETNKSTEFIFRYYEDQLKDVYLVLSEYLNNLPYGVKIIFREPGDTYIITYYKDENNVLHDTESKADVSTYSWSEYLLDNLVFNRVSKGLVNITIDNDEVIYKSV